MASLSYTGAEKKCDKQQAFAYILYMICGSYFHKCVCANKPLLERMYLHYCELKGTDREKYEKMVIDRMEQIDPRFLKRLAGLNCSAELIKIDGGYRIEFLTGGFEEIVASVNGKGKVNVNPVFMGINWKKG